MAKDRKLAMLKEVPLFWGISDGDLKQIGALVEQVLKPAGAVLMKEGEYGKELVIIASGKAKVTQKGRKIRTVGPGEAIGELALLDQGARSATVTAETDMTLYLVESRAFTGLVMKAPTVGVKIMKGMAERLRAAEKRALQ